MIKKRKESPGKIREQLKWLTDTSEFKHKVISFIEFRQKIPHRARSPNLLAICNRVTGSVLLTNMLYYEL